jgi:beta-glucosidase
MFSHLKKALTLLLCLHAMNANAENGPHFTPTPAPVLPTNFRFCVSTAAHQVEGQNFNSDWWQWEQVPGHIKNGDTSLVATDSWNHVAEDIANMKSLDVDTYRFSIEWAKIETAPGQFDEAILDRYLSFIDQLKAAGIEPMVTIYHFTLPLWVSSQGGWEWDGIADAFDVFVRHVAARMGTRVTLWITLNEPMSIITAGYMSNVFPPGKNDIRGIGHPMANMIRAHARAYHALHEILDTDNFKVRVGLAHHLRIFDPKTSINLIDRFIADKFDEIFNWSIPNALINGVFKFTMPFVASADYFIPEAIGTQDFFGINYYSRDMVSLDLRKNPPLIRSVKKGAPVSDLDWEIYPEGISRLIDGIHARNPRMPIWVTENGLADDSDEKRMPFIRAHLAEVAKEINKGITIEGYCHWTLNDNFEWAEGYWPHFGFYALEKGTEKRIPRPSAQAFSDLIKATKAGNQ